MKKITSLFLTLTILIVGFLFVSNNILAKADVQIPTLSEANCFDPGLYRFQSVQVSVGPDKSDYLPGENIIFTGELINQNDYPVVDGNVFVRIGELNPSYITDGHNTRAEFIALENISINGSSTLPISFSWTVPENLGQGSYQADYFFSVGKKFNLGGLPFTNEIIVGFSRFLIKGENTNAFILDRQATKVNEVDYNHVGAWPSIEEGESINITQPIKNFTDKEIKVDITYDLYYWDSLDPKDKIETKTETVTISAKGSKVLSYVIPEAKQAVYYLRLEAKYKGVSSIVNIRTTSDINQARINYPAITNFPLKQGEKANLFSCFHNVYGSSPDRKVLLTLTDKYNNIVAQGEYKNGFSESMSAAMMNFTANKDYTFLKLKAELFNADGQIEDSYENEYNCQNLKSDKCSEMLSTNLNQKVINYILILILISFIGLAVSFRFVKGLIYRKSLITIFAFLLIFSLIIMAWTILSQTGELEAEEPTLTDSRVKTQTFTSPYLTIFTVTAGTNSAKTLIAARVFEDLSVNMNYLAIFNGKNILKIGETVTIDTAIECTFNGSGSTMDTPYCGQSLPANTSVAGKVDASVIFTNQPTSLSLVSSNPEVISCDKHICTAIAPGQAYITRIFDETTVDVTSLTYKRGAFSFLSAYSYPNLDAWSGILTNKINSFGMDFNDIKNGNGQRSINIPSFEPSWLVTVEEGPIVIEEPLEINCSVNPNVPDINEDVTWSATVSGGDGSYSYEWSGDVIGDTATVTKSYSTAGTKIGTVEIKSGSQSASTTCSVLVPALTVSCSASPNPVAINEPVTWSATVSGGNGDYDYSWSGTDGLSGNTATVKKTYSTVGGSTKTGTITVKSGLQSVSTTCSTLVKNLVVSCSANPNPALINQPVTWTAIASGGNGSYSYSWPWFENVDNTDTVTETYTSRGFYSGMVNVISGVYSASTRCNLEVRSLNASCSVNPNVALVGEEVTWTVTVSDGNGLYYYSWDGTDGLAGDTATVTKSYSIDGTKIGRVNINSGIYNDYIVCSNSVNVKNPINNEISCQPNKSTAKVGEEVTWSINKPLGNSELYTYNWDGDDNLEGFTSTIKKTYSTPNVKYAYPTIKYQEVLYNPTCSVNIIPNDNPCIGDNCTNNGGGNNGGGGSTNSTSTPNSGSDPSCTISSPTSPVKVNTNTTWSATEDSCSDCQIQKAVSNSQTSNPEYQNTNSSDGSWTEIFKTIGTKYIYVRFVKDGETKSSCDTSINVTQTGGDINEI